MKPKSKQSEREQVHISSEARRQFTSWLGKRSYKARLKRLGIERLQEIARENGKRGGRPRKPLSELSASGKYQRARRATRAASGKRG